MQKLFTTIQVRAWQHTALKSIEVAAFQASAGIIVYLSTLLPNWHPTTPWGILEFALANLVLYFLKKWNDTSSVMKANYKAQQAAEAAVSTPAAPAPVTPPAQ